jgi:putative ABC transport system substrate-binding protein
MKRREFITLLGGAAATWPLPAWAQQLAMPVIGYVSSRSAQADAHLVAAFRSGLREIGSLEGQNVGIEFRWADGDYTRHEGLVAGLVRQKVDVIVATSAPTAVAAKKVPRGAIPLVFTSGEDPVKEGLVSSFNRPGGDTTGIYVFTVGLGPKRLEILRELVPSAAIIAFLVNPKVASTEFQLKDVQDAARAIGQQIEIFAANSESELNVAFDNMARSKVGALLVGADPFFQVWRSQFIDLEHFGIEFRQCTNGQISWRPVVSQATRLVEAKRTVWPGPTQAVSSKGSSHPTCQSSSLLSSNWSSISKPPRRSGDRVTGSRTGCAHHRSENPGPKSQY